MAVREVLKQHQMVLEPKKRFEEQIPAGFLPSGEEEAVEQERQRIVRFWAQFSISVNRTRRVSRQTVFQTGMSRLCKEFSRHHEDIKMKFVVDGNQEKNKNRPCYKLVLMQLSAVPATCRHRGQNFVAEIPPPEREAQAELVETIQPATAPTAFAAVVPVAAVVPIPAAPAAPRHCITSDVFVSAGSNNPLVSNGLSLPVAHQVDDVAVAERSSPLDQMEHLESIRAFLSGEEYRRIRQNILD